MAEMYDARRNTESRIITE